MMQLEDVQVRDLSVKRLLLTTLEISKTIFTLILLLFKLMHILVKGSFLEPITLTTITEMKMLL